MKLDIGNDHTVHDVLLNDFRKGRESLDHAIRQSGTLSPTTRESCIAVVAAYDDLISQLERHKC